MTNFDHVPLCSAFPADDASAVSAAHHALSAAQAERVSDSRNLLVTAASLPRDEFLARQRLLALCAEPSFAAAALHEDSPTLSLAATAARLRGNLVFGLREDQNRCEAFAWDTETNTRAVRLFRSSRENRSAVERDRLAAALLDMLPAELMTEALERCRRTLSEKNAHPRDKAPQGTSSGSVPDAVSDAAPDGISDGAASVPLTPEAAETPACAPEPPADRTAAPRKPDGKLNDEADTTPDCAAGKNRGTRSRSATRRSSRKKEPADGNESGAASGTGPAPSGDAPATGDGVTCAEAEPSPESAPETVPENALGTSSETGSAARSDAVPAALDDTTPAPASDIETAGTTGTNPGDLANSADGVPSADGASPADHARPGALRPDAEVRPSFAGLRYRPELILCPERCRNVDTLECHDCPEHDCCRAYA